MGQCDICSRDMQYNMVNCDDLLRDISHVALGQEIVKLRNENKEYLNHYKFAPMSDKSFYRGKLNNLQRDGYGELYCDHFNYFGFFKQDLPHGQGAIITETTCVFGEFKEGELNGKGKEWNKQYSFQGIYRNGERESGTLQKEQLTYNGNFKNNEYHGEGKLTLIEGDSYEGRFNKGKFQGEGQFIFANGNKYKGGYLDGKYHGYGQFTWQNGNSYRGEYYEGKRHGFGVLKLENIEFAGTWKDGAREGHGSLLLAGDFGFGEWKDNFLLETV